MEKKALKIGYIISAIIAVIVIGSLTFLFLFLSNMYAAPYERMETELNAYAKMLKDEGLVTTETVSVQFNGDYSVYGATEGLYNTSSTAHLKFKCENVVFELTLFEFRHTYSVSIGIENFDLKRATASRKEQISKVLELTNRFYNTDAFSISNIEKNYSAEYLEDSYESIKYDLGENYQHKERASYKSIVYSEPNSENGKSSYTYIAEESLNTVRITEILITFDRIVDDAFLESAYEVNDYEK